MAHDTEIFTTLLAPVKGNPPSHRVDNARLDVFFVISLTRRVGGYLPWQSRGTKLDATRVHDMLCVHIVRPLLSFRFVCFLLITVFFLILNHLCRGRAECFIYHLNTKQPFYEIKFWNVICIMSAILFKSRCCGDYHVTYTLSVTPCYTHILCGSRYK